MANTDLALRGDADGTAALTLNRPELNPPTPNVFVALRGHLEQLSGDDSIRCVVLRGSGDAVGPGHDLGSVATGEAPGA